MSTSEVHEFMRNGGFSVQLSNDNTFGRIPIDQTLEEIVVKIRKHLGIPRALVWNLEPYKDTTWQFARNGWLC